MTDRDCGSYCRLMGRKDYLFGRIGDSLWGCTYFGCWGGDLAIKCIDCLFWLLGDWW